MLLLRCLIYQGQLQKALAYLIKHMPEPGEDAQLAELAGALFLAVPTELRGPHDAESHLGAWLRAAVAAKAALNSWTGAKPVEEVDALLAKIPLNSPFKAARLILKSLLLAPRDGLKARRMLKGVAQELALRVPQRRRPGRNCVRFRGAAWWMGAQRYGPAEVRHRNERDVGVGQPNGDAAH